MGKNIVILIGSPRPKGSTAALARAFAEGGIHEAIMAYEDVTFFEILAEELALRDLDADRATAENYDEVMERMEEYMGEFEAHGTDHISVDME